MALSTAEKERLLKALEEDREFRYAVMGLIGFKELLERFTRLEDRQQKLEERFAQLEERQQRLEEGFKKLMERQQKLEGRFAKLEERVIKLEERFAKLEERFAQLEERFMKLEERQQRLEDRMADVLTELRELRRVVIVVAHRFGVISEAGLREAMKYVVQEIFGVAEVKQWIYKDDEGVVYGYPAVIEVDVIVRDKEHILIEVKSRVSRGEVAELYKIGKLYERVCGIKPKLAIVGGLIDPSAYEAAVKLGIEIKPAIKEY